GSRSMSLRGDRSVADIAPSLVSGQTGLSSSRAPLARDQRRDYPSPGAIPKYGSANAMICPNAGAATVPPKIDPVCGSSTITAHSSFGSDAGANPMNDATYAVSEYLPVNGSTLLAVPVLPASS